MKEMIGTNIHKEKNHTHDCWLCQSIDSYENPCFIMKMKYGILLLNRNQNYKGRCLYALPYHITDLTELGKQRFSNSSQELYAVAEAVKKCFDADLVNLSMLCNQVPHLHWHIIPRYSNDNNWGSPPWPSERLELSNEEYSNLAKLIRDALSKRSVYCIN